MDNGDDKFLTKVAVTALSVLGMVYLAQIIQNVVAPAQAEELPFGSPWLLPVGLIMNVSYSEDEEPLYVGEAYPGTLGSEAGWRIYRYEYEVVGGDLEMVGLRFAQGNTKLDKVWDNREDYEYS